MDYKNSIVEIIHRWFYNIDHLVYNEVLRLYELEFIEDSAELHINHRDMLMSHIEWYFDVEFIKLPYADMMKVYHAMDDYVWYPSDAEFNRVIKLLAEVI